MNSRRTEQKLNNYEKKHQLSRTSSSPCSSKKSSIPSGRKKLDTGIEEKTRIFNDYSVRQKEATENYTTALKRAIRYAWDEAEADALVADAKEEYDRVQQNALRVLRESRLNLME